jgi:hypothetical protein
MISNCVNGDIISLTVGPSAGYYFFSGFVKFSIVSVIMSIVLMYVSSIIASSNIWHAHICHHKYSMLFLDQIK